MPFPDRNERLSDIVSHLPTQADFPLLKSVALDDPARASVVDAANFYIWLTLSEYFPERRFVLGEDLLETYRDAVMALPNITPNGLILPKEPNVLAYNILHRRVADLVARLGLAEHISAIQFPINVRLGRGAPNPAADSRPRASTKPHSDIWAGDPAGALVFMLPLLGDVQTVGVDFFEPQDLAEEFLGPLDDYDEGADIFRASTRYDAGFRHGELIIFDPYLLHQTLRPGDGLRVSIDFRFLPARKLDSDGAPPDGVLRTLLPVEEWLDYGRGRLVATGEPLREFRGEDRSTVGYEVALRTVRFGDPS